MPRDATRSGEAGTDWDEGNWSPDQDEAAQRARRLLKRTRGARLGRVGDRLFVFGQRFGGNRWVKRVSLGVVIAATVIGVAFGGLWWRLGEGPISIDFATPWLAAAVEDNLGRDHSVEVGGTQIERAGRLRVAVRVLNMVVRDRDKAVVANAPKAEVKLSFLSLLTGRPRAESLSLVDAELYVQIQRDGRVVVSTANTARPIVSTRPQDVVIEPRRSGGAPVPPTAAPLGAARPSPPAETAAAPNTPAATGGGMQGLVALLAWIDQVSAAGLDGYDLNEIGLKNGSLVVDDQQGGSKWNFSNITLDLRRLSSGGIAFRIGEEEPARPWSLRVAVGAASDGVRSVEVVASKVMAKDVMLALRLSDTPFTSDIPISGRLRGEIGRDGLPTFLTGNISVTSGTIVDRKVPDYPMTIDQAQIDLDWDASRRVLMAPFQVVAGGNRITLLAHLEPPNDTVPNWQMGLRGGTIVLPGQPGELPAIFDRIAVRVRFDTDNRRILLTQADFSNGDIGVAGTGTFDYSTSDPRITGGIAGTPMTISVLKRMWIPFITPEVREWVINRIEAGTLTRAEIAVNAHASTLARGGPPIPEDGLSINFIGNGIRVRPVDELPAVHDADMRIRLSGRTANVTIAQGLIDTPGGRRMTISDFVFDIADLAPKPMQSKVRFKVDGSVAAVAEVLNSDRLNEFSGLPIDPATSKGNVTAQIGLAMPLKDRMSKADTNYTIGADLSNVSIDKLVMGQKLEANNLKVLANNQGYQIRGDVKINGQQAALDYRKPQGDGDAEVRMTATLDDASRTRLGIDIGAGVSGPIGVKVNGRLGAPDRESRFGIEADLNGARIDNILPGWVKSPGRAGRVTFNVSQKPQSTRFEDIAVDGAGVNIKGALELDQSGELLNAAFPVYQASEGDKVTLRAERTPEGVLKIGMRGDVFDARNFIRSATSGTSSDSKSKQRNGDFDLEIKLGAVAGFNGEAVRGLDVKLSRRNGVIKTFGLNGKVGRDTQIIGDMRGRNTGREVMYVETGDAGAVFRFTDVYSKMYGGQMWVAMEPPTIDSSPQEGLITVRDFNVRGEGTLQQIAANSPQEKQQQQQLTQNSISFSRARAEFTRSSGLLAIREGLLSGPVLGATIEGRIDYNSNQVKMSGTFLPAYGINNMFGQIPIVGMFLGGGSNEGLIGITYEVVGSPSSPTLRYNPMAALAPGVLRKVFEFSTGREQTTPQMQDPARGN